MPCVSLEQSDRESSAKIIESNPEIDHQIDLVNCKVIAGDEKFTFQIRDGARESLLNGKWDPIDELLGKGTEIEKVASSLHYT